MWRSLLHDSLLKKGNEWPGWYNFWDKEVEFLGSTKFHGPNMPDFGHPIHPKILERELEAAGFEIEYINFAALADQDASTLTHEEHEKFVKGENINADLAEKVERQATAGLIKESRRVYRENMKDYNKYVQKGLLPTLEECLRFVKEDDSKGDLKQIEDQVKKFKRLQQFLESEKKYYNYKNKSIEPDQKRIQREINDESPDLTRLPSMDTVFAIAVKKTE